jgi:hypothetical protein
VWSRPWSWGLFTSALVVAYTRMSIPVEPRRRRGCSWAWAAKQRRKAGARGTAHGVARGAARKARNIWGAILEAIVIWGGSNCARSSNLEACLKRHRGPRSALTNHATGVVSSVEVSFSTSAVGNGFKICLLFSCESRLSLISQLYTYNSIF